jgi:hypothetical protein
MNFPEKTQLPGTNVFVPSFVVADNGYGCMENTQTPVELTKKKQWLTEKERAFNYRLVLTLHQPYCLSISSLALCRIQVERLFGFIRTHFRVYDKTQQFNVGHCRRLFQVTFLLHMFIMSVEGTGLSF